MHSFAFMLRPSLLFVLFFCLCMQLSGQKDNPFDIKRSDSTELIEEPVTLDPLPVEETKIDDENPFTVSHIPIRKNQYEQIEKLTINQGKAEESISITHLPLWIVVFSLCVLAFMIVRNKNHVYNLVRTIFNTNLLRQKAFEEQGGLSLMYMLGYMLFLSNLTLFLYMSLTRIFAESMGMGYFKLLLWVCLFFLGKHLVLYFFSRLYDFEKEASVYSFTISTIYNLLAIVFLTLNVIVLFGPDSWTRFIFVIGVLCFIIFLLSRYYKGLTLARKYLSEHVFHFFLYFCAFEFSPWLIVYTLFRDFI